MRFHRLIFALLSVAFALASCGSSASAQTPTPTPQASATPSPSVDLCATTDPACPRLLFAGHLTPPPATQGTPDPSTFPRFQLACAPHDAAALKVTFGALIEWDIEPDPAVTLLGYSPPTVIYWIFNHPQHGWWGEVTYIGGPPELMPTTGFDLIICEPEVP